MAQPNCAHCKMRIYKKGCLWYRRETKLLIAQTANFLRLVMIMMMMVM